MKKLFAIVFTTLIYVCSFASIPLQQTIELEETPPPPPTGGTGSSIDFIVPILLISVVFLVVYIINKNKKLAKTV